MSFKELVINAGSSSLKYQVFLMPEQEVLAKGVFEEIGGACKFTHKKVQKDHEIIVFKSAACDAKNHHEAIELLIKTLVDEKDGILKSMDEIAAVGHRVLHGGEAFHESVIVNDEVKKVMNDCVPLGPLHMPANIMGIEVCEEIMKGVPQIAVFDTAFHQSLPEEAYMYAIPYKYYEKYAFRKYGFHGTSHRYVSDRAIKFLQNKYPLKYKNVEDLKIVTCHMGNGSSITAVKGGKSVDTTMGLTPLEGIMMGTRSGSIDPALICFLMEKENLTAHEVDTILNKKSGFLGLTARYDQNGFEIPGSATSDNRAILERADAGDERAILIRKMLAHQLAKCVGSYIVAMGGIDAVVFTGGIGENTTSYRADLAKKLGFLGVEIDFVANSVRGQEIEVSTKESKVKILVIPTDEELLIAQDTYELVSHLDD